jgi:outer membrane protein
MEMRDGCRAIEWLVSQLVHVRGLLVAGLLAVSVRAAGAPDGAIAAPKPLTLAEAEVTALRNQPLLAEARGQVETAEGRVDEARAGYLPQVAATGSYQRTTANFAPRPGTLPANMTTGNTLAATPVTWDPQFNYYQFGATATQLIYDFGQTSGRWRSASASRDAAASSQHAVELQTLLNVRRAFFQARAQRDLVAVAEETVSNQEKHVEQTRAFVRTGIQPDINLATVLTALANAKLQLVGARNNQAVAGAQLAQAMGVAIGAAYTLSDDAMTAIPGEDGPAAPLAARAVQGRPELASLGYQRLAQERLIGALHGAYAPSLGGIANVTDAGPSIDRTVPNWYVGLTLSWAIFQGGFTRGQVREAKGTLATITGQQEAQRLQVEVDVEQARLAVQAAKAAIAASDEALVNARQQLTLAEGRYTHGLGSAVELGDAQVADTNAKAQVVQAGFNLAVARAQLLAALGER